jgi:hypothetical protein
MVDEPTPKEDLKDVQKTLDFYLLNGFSECLFCEDRIDPDKAFCDRCGRRNPLFILFY